MRQILDMVFHFQTGAQKVLRYGINPFVIGDNVAEHLARAVRLLVYITPDLKDEFPDNQTLIEDIFVCLTLHDDDEIIVGYDIPTAIKVHDEDNDAEIKAFTEKVSSLPDKTKKFVVEAFSSFRNKSSLAAQITKAIDNIVGNQLVIEQEVGLINPNSARFCIEYALKVSGLSKIIDSLIIAQIGQIIEFRNNLNKNDQEVERMRKLLNLKDSIKIKELLKIDITDHKLDKTKVYHKIEEL